MILVFLPNRTVSAALFTAEEVEEHIRFAGELFCPACGSKTKSIYFSRKSIAGSRWMEIRAKCGACSTQFSLPDNVLQGFWRNGEANEKLTQSLKITGKAEPERELAGVV